MSSESAFKTAVGDLIGYQLLLLCLADVKLLQASYY